MRPPSPFLPALLAACFGASCLIAADAPATAAKPPAAPATIPATAKPFEILPGRPAAPFTALTPEGQEFSSASLKGKVVLIEFWATWCPDCAEQLPTILELQKQYAAQGLVIVGISIDQEGPAVVKKFVAEHKLTYPIVMDNPSIPDQYDAKGTPTTFIIDRAGNLVAKHAGTADKKMFDALLKPLLAAPVPPAAPAAK